MVQKNAKDGSVVAYDHANYAFAPLFETCYPPSDSAKPGVALLRWESPKIKAVS